MLQCMYVQDLDIAWLSDLIIAEKGWLDNTKYGSTAEDPHLSMPSKKIEPLLPGSCTPTAPHDDIPVPVQTSPSRWSSVLNYHVRGTVTGFQHILTPSACQLSVPLLSQDLLVCYTHQIFLTNRNERKPANNFTSSRSSSHTNTTPYSNCISLKE